VTGPGGDAAGSTPMAQAQSGAGPKAHRPASRLAPYPHRRTRIGPRAKVDITPARGLERVRRA